MDNRPRPHRRARESAGAGVAMSANWTGPHESDLAADGVSLRGPVPPERWPYCLPGEHQTCCLLHRMYDPGRVSGFYCDCDASATDDDGTST